MKFDLTTMWHEMGPVPKGVVIILLLMSIWAIGITVERLLAFRRNRRQSIAYIQALQPLLATPGHLHQAMGLERSLQASPVARVIAAGIHEFVHRFAAGPAGIEGASRSMERLKDRELMGLRRGLPGLATIASSAPFVGLLGTVFGIITAFRKMSDPNAPGGLASVSGGIAEALITTAVGLTVAIIAVWFYNYFSTRVEHLTVDVDETAGEVLECMRRELEAFPQ
jgi:biopolymer transport protein ExbB/TolQ